MEEFWNEVAMRSQSQENLLDISSDKENTDQNNEQFTDHLKVDDAGSNKSPRVQRRSPAVIRRKKRNTEYRNVRKKHLSTFRTLNSDRQVFFFR